MINVGIDWAEAHHDVCVEDDGGNVLTKARVPEGIEGLERIHEMLGAHATDASEVVIGIELDRGLLVGALVAAGYEVHAVNPLGSLAIEIACHLPALSPTRAMPACSPK